MNLLPKITATAVAAMVLASCGTSSGSDSKSSSASSPSDPASSITSSSTADPATGITMKGTGYAYHLPDGWEDITSQLKKSQPGIDTGGRLKPATPPFTANLNTLSTPSQISGAPSSSDLKSLAAQVKQSVTSLAPNVVTKAFTSVGGAPAVHQEGAATSGATKFYLVQYFAVHGGNNYGITFAFPPSMNQADRTKVVEPVLASWKFQ